MGSQEINNLFDGSEDVQIHIKTEPEVVWLETPEYVQDQFKQQLTEDNSISRTAVKRIHAENSINNEKRAKNTRKNVPAGSMSVNECKNAVTPGTGYLKRVPPPQTAVGLQLLHIEKEKLKIRKNKLLENDNEDRDEDVGFFNSVLPHVRKLTPRDKLTFQMRVQRILFDVVYPPPPLQQSTSTASSISISPILPTSK
ncbi:uncharacterized protein LOC111059223 [Nilaparvata lugens]|uniref:uncharacterized protein LOC111059223 n=1 Tax=Nilaparvata lugens TaxID=108931 RepID=UPI000B988AFB|nr:uncharacterized protein LOC111059223 [Nilaparvata lugens]